jgi:uncharacterized membrane protein
MAARTLWLCVLSLAGLLVSAYVWRSQRFNKPIACWTKDCDRVIRSPYSRLLGVHNSAIGFWLFLAIFFLALLMQQGAQSWSAPAFTAIMVLSFIGTLVSLYLAYVQFFVLKGICNWCLTSTFLILAIFILAVTSG